MFKNKTTSNVKATSSIGEQSKNTIIQLHYKRTGPGKWYRQDFRFPDSSGDALPENLKLECTTNTTNQSKYILTLPHHHGTRRVFTELHPTSFEGWFYGKVPLFVRGKIINCLIIVQVSPNEYAFRLYFFKGCFPHWNAVYKRISEKILDILQFRQQAVKAGTADSKTTSIYDDPGFLDANLHIDQRPLVANDTVHKKAHWK